MPPSQSPIDLAQALQSLVTSTYSSAQEDTIEAYLAKTRISNLALALIRAVQGPREYTATLAESCQESAALHFISSLGVADHIAAAPTRQLSLKELSEKTGAREEYLSVAMKTLLYHGYFAEPCEGVYANNDFSFVLHSPSPSCEDSMADAIGLAADDAAKATARLLDAATKSGTTANKLANNTTFDLFEFMNSPGQEWRGRRAGRAMVQLHGMANGGVGEDFAWEQVKSPIIDIGGGIGSLATMLLVVEKNRELRFTIVDLEKTIENAKKVWSAKPQWMQDRISFVGGDFLKSSPAESKIPTVNEGAGTYVIRHVLHDWNDAQVVTILKNVRGAMLEGVDPMTTNFELPKLIVVEMMLGEDSSRFTYTTSMQLLALSGGITRTEAEFRKLFEEAGFRVERTNRVRGVDKLIEMKPVV